MDNKIYCLLLSRKMYQSELAKAANLDCSYLSKIISCKIVPTLPTAYKIAKALGMRVEEVFLSSEGNKNE